MDGIMTEIVSLFIAQMLSSSCYYTFAWLYLETAAIHTLLEQGSDSDWCLFS